MTRHIAILGEFSERSETHRLTNEAMRHSCDALDIDLVATWIATPDIDESVLTTHSGIWIAPGSPYEAMDKVLWAIERARREHLPCLGTCGGFQHMILEYARNVLGFADATHAEYDPYASQLLISALDCSLVGREMQLTFAAGSQVAEIYAATTATERYYCNFGVNPEFAARLSSGPVKISGHDSEGKVRVLELPGHPFFVGTLYVPQSRSTPATPHPLVSAFIQAACT